jgi:hypothetical protein
MIIVSYVYKKPIIVIKHRFRHKFQKCKEDAFTNLKFDYTWQHDLLTKLSFINFASPRHVIFERSCKLHHIPHLTFINYLWLPSITFFKCNPIVWRPHQCVHTTCWTIIRVSRFGSYMSWINFPSDILLELFTKYLASQSSPHMTFTSLPIEYASNLKVVACCLANRRREFVILDLL